MKIVIGGGDGPYYGPVWVALSENGLIAVAMCSNEGEMRQMVRNLTGRDATLDPTQTDPVVAQVADYLGGQRHHFDLAIDWSFMPQFQQDVLREVYAIPYGQVVTYGEIARKLGKPGASRAVGRANATNPMAPIIPCHRVLGSDHKLHGYGGPGGLETKAWLLRMEGNRLL